MKDVELIIKACEFAAEKHVFQRRKGCLKIPYINHPLTVCRVLSDAGENDISLLLAAILHDTIEDTNTTEDEISKLFGKKTLEFVLEVTDDMSLQSKVRKDLQVKKAPYLSNEAKLIKIADKLCNIGDLIRYPIQWEKERKIQYIEWSNLVFDKCRGINLQLDELFIKTSNNALNAIAND